MKPLQLSRVTAPPFGRTQFGDDHFIYSSHKILWAGITGLGEELQIPMMLTECSQNELKSEDWKMWLKISKKLGRYLPYDFVFEGDGKFHRKIKKIAESKDTFQLCAFFGSKQDPERCDDDDDCGSCKDLLAREIEVLSMPIQMAYIVIPLSLGASLSERTGVIAVMVPGNKGSGGRGRFMRLIVPRKVQPLHPKRGSEISVEERIKLFRSKPALTSEQAQGISSEYLAGYVTAIVGKQPVNFAVASNKPDTDDFGTLFRHQYEKFGEKSVGARSFTGLDSNRRGYHVVLVVERSLVMNAMREPLHDKYLVNHYHEEENIDEQIIVRHKVGYDLTALIVCGPIEDVRGALLEKNVDYFSSGMLVLAEGCDLYLLPKDKRVRIAESLCSLESGALWKQVDLGHAVGPPFKGQEGVLRSACRPWELRNGDDKGNEEDESREEAEEEEEELFEIMGENNQTVYGAGAVEGAGIKKKEEKSGKQKLKEGRMAEAKKLLGAREKFRSAKKLSPREEMAKFREDLARLIEGAAANEDDDRLETCRHCGKVDFDMGFCGRCRDVWYCDDECFQKDRKKHAKACKGKDGEGPGPSAFDAALAKCIQLTEDVVIPDFDAMRRAP